MAIEKLKNLPVIGRAFFSNWMKKINEVIEGVNGVSEDVADISTGVVEKLEVIEEQFDPNNTNSLAYTVTQMQDGYKFNVSENNNYQFLEGFARAPVLSFPEVIFSLDHQYNSYNLPVSGCFMRAGFYIIKDSLTKNSYGAYSLIGSVSCVTGSAVIRITQPEEKSIAVQLFKDPLASSLIFYSSELDAWLSDANTVFGYCSFTAYK